MSDQIFHKPNSVTVTRFAGGAIRGPCYQLTSSDPASGTCEQYIQVRAKDAEDMAVAILTDMGWNMELAHIYAPL